MSVDRSRHWDDVYSTKSSQDVSWYQPTPETSMRLVSEYAPRGGRCVDIGAGASTFVDSLLDAGWRQVTVLDVSREALEVVRARLEQRDDAASVELAVADILQWRPQHTYDLWHDRAVLHFLSGQEVRDYAATAATSVGPGGIVVIATFAPDGPEQCSGLPTTRYSADELAVVFAPDFSLVHSEAQSHVTPWGAVQSFTWVVLRRD